MFYNDPSFDLVSPNLVGNGGRGVYLLVVVVRAAAHVWFLFAR